jgi:penicillin-binding protein activator
MTVYLMTVVAATAMALNSGCSAFRASTSDVDVNKPEHMGTAYDYTDMRSVSDKVANSLLASPAAGGAPAPILMIAGVQNRTEQYVDTKALTDRIRTVALNSGKFQFVNEARRDELLKEQGYQAANATPETQVAVGKQLGAKYMLSGSLIEMRSSSPRQVRVSKDQVSYYKLTIELTDLETGLIKWTTEEEFARKTSLPLIGW